VIPWEEIDRAEVPGDEGEVTLLKRGSEFSIRTAGVELMNSRRHGSEDALAELTCSRFKQKSGLRILIGGLGMGFTVAAALGQSGPDALITVSELIPAVVRWNREHLGHLAGMPLDDPRVSVEEEDVGETIRKRKSAWDAILLD
jgi:spermidine synthase